MRLHGAWCSENTEKGEGCKEYFVLYSNVIRRPLFKIGSLLFYLHDRDRTFLQKTMVMIY
jgi:hypothetical protein